MVRHGRSRSCEFRPFWSAREIVWAVRLESREAFHRWQRQHGKLLNIPSNPNRHYRNEGWEDWPHFCGFLGRRRRCRYQPFGVASQTARTLGIRDSAEWRTFIETCRRIDLPLDPSRVYREWIGWQSFLGIPRRGAFSWLEKHAVAELRSLGLNGSARSMSFDGKRCRVDFLCSSHDFAWEYDGFRWHAGIERTDLDKSLRIAKHTTLIRVREAPLDRLGHDDVCVSSAPSVHEVVSATLCKLIELGIGNRQEVLTWQIYVRQGRLRSSLATLKQGAGFLSFEAARTIARAKKFSSVRAFQKWSASKRRPPQFPSDPRAFYGEAFLDWPDFLGREQLAPKNRAYYDRSDFQAAIARNGITTRAQFELWKTRPNFDPRCPRKPYDFYRRRGQWTNSKEIFGASEHALRREKFSNFTARVPEDAASGRLSITTHERNGAGLPGCDA